MVPQTFASTSIVPLTDEERQTYVDKNEQGDVRRVVSPDGFILLEIETDWCRVITGSGDSKTALAQFREQLKSAGGTEDEDERTQDGHERVSGMISLKDGYSAVVLFVGDMAHDNAGFFGSTVRVRKQ
jgi:hypothetical protein